MITRAHKISYILLVLTVFACTEPTISNSVNQYSVANIPWKVEKINYGDTRIISGHKDEKKMVEIANAYFRENGYAKYNSGLLFSRTLFNEVTKETYFAFYLSEISDVEFFFILEENQKELRPALFRPWGN